MSEGEQPKQSAASGLVALVMLAGGAWFFFGGGLDAKVESDMQAISDKVAADAVEQYEIVKRSGDSMKACVHAGLVAAAYVQAKNEQKFQEWNAIEKADCSKAGVPQH